MSRYTSATDADRKAMLESIGAGSIDELFADIPEGVRLDRRDRPAARQAGAGGVRVPARPRGAATSRPTTRSRSSAPACTTTTCPSLVDALLSRSEFLTPYTPYQPEVSQGTLQVMFEYQTAISELTGLPVSNATLYEAPSAVASAGWLARLQNGRGRFLVSRGLHPHSREALATTAAGYGTAVEEVAARGRRDRARSRSATTSRRSSCSSRTSSAPSRTSRRWRRSPRRPARCSSSRCDPLTLGVLKPPGEFDVDIAVGEGQSLGNRLDYGGPSFGFFAAQQAYLRRMPGRIAGETTDADGKRGFVLTLQTREQHIRREKATHNITTAQTLNALAGVVYLSWLGRRGIVELGELLLHRTAYARRALAALDGVELLHEQPVVREFAVRLAAPVDRVIERCAADGVNPGYPLGADYDGVRGRAAGGDHRAALAAPTSTGWPRCWAPRWPPSARR